MCQTAQEAHYHFLQSWDCSRSSPDDVRAGAADGPQPGRFWPRAERIYEEPARRAGEPAPRTGRWAGGRARCRLRRPGAGR
jgi:hypothetical protein